jgi:glycosyltransferase involved in cell wall biosynthesis
MRLLFLAFRDPSNPYVGGGDMYINELAKGCAKRGHSVTILSSRFPGSSAIENVENVQVIRVGSSFTMTLAIFIHYFRHLRGRFDIVIEEIMGGPRIPFFASLYMKEKIVGILQQKHKEIFRQQFSFPIAFSFSIVEHILPLLYRNKTIVVNSKRTKEDLRSIGYQERNMIVVYPGISEYFLDQNSTVFSHRLPIVICLTKLRRYKLIDQAIRAMKIVCKTQTDCQLIVAGRTNDVEPEYENELNQLVQDLDLEEIVHFEKDISEYRKIMLLKTCRALVLPSAIEGFGIVVIEANACGTPAIVSDRVPAAVNGYNAVVTQCFDFESMSKNIVTLVSDEKKWKVLSRNSIRWAKRFSWDSSVNHFIAIIEGKTGLPGGATD